MRFVLAVAGVGLVAMVGACNAILGNESDYVLVGAGGEDSGPHAGSSGAASGGRGGVAGSSTNSGGKGGASAGGKAGSGTAGRAGKGGSDSAGEGGGGDEPAGAGGDAGAPSCVSRGAENCFNGVDDDCNGDLDCEDSACSGPAECRPVPAGAELGYFANPGDTNCPSGYTRLDLYQDLQVPTQCNGCSCVSPTDLLCDSGIYGHGSYACPSYQFDGPLRDVYNDSCTLLPSDPNIHYYSIRGTSQCTPAGTPTLDPTTWAGSAIFCLANRVGAGCGAGKACVPADAPAGCTLGSGGCSADYADDRGTWYEGVDDQRACTDCQCGLGTADCSASYIGLYGDGSCATNAFPLQSVPDQGDACALSFPPQSAKIIGNPVPGSGSCLPNNFMTGEATPTSGHNACCAL